MNLSKPVARYAVQSISALGRSDLGQYFPLSVASRLLNHRATPWLAARAYRPGIQQVNGVQMEIPQPPAWGGGGEFHMALGTYEQVEIEFVVNHLQPGDTFLDIGSHIGYFALPAALRVGPSGTVLAVEPSPSSLENLKRNVELNGFSQVRVIAAAASDKDGTAAFTISSQSAMWNTLRGEVLPGEGHTAITVQTRSIDSLAAEAGWPRIRGLKMDVEGAESAVLQGAKQTLERYPNAFVMFEISGGTPQRVEASMETLKWFQTRGYRFRPLIHRNNSRLVTADELAPRLRRREWYEHLLNVSAEFPQ